MKDPNDLYTSDMFQDDLTKKHQNWLDNLKRVTDNSTVAINEAQTKGDSND